MLGSDVLLYRADFIIRGRALLEMGALRCFYVRVCLFFFRVLGGSSLLYVNVVAVVVYTNQFFFFSACAFWLVTGSVLCDKRF
jgi:hypothetical protein